MLKPAFEIADHLASGALVPVVEDTPPQRRPARLRLPAQAPAGPEEPPLHRLHGRRREEGPRRNPRPRLTGRAVPGPTRSPTFRNAAPIPARAPARAAPACPPGRRFAPTQAGAARGSRPSRSSPSAPATAQDQRIRSRHHRPPRITATQHPHRRAHPRGQPESRSPAPMPDTIHRIPLAEIDEASLTRDRTALDPEATRELRNSILKSGLRMPIEVYALPEPRGPHRYGLLSGFRRLAVFRDLDAGWQLPGYAAIPAFLRTPADRAEALTAMVEENAIRADLSPWEQARIAVLARDAETFPTIEEGDRPPLPDRQHHQALPPPRHRPRRRGPRRPARQPRGPVAPPAPAPRQRAPRQLRRGHRGDAPHRPPRPGQPVGGDPPLSRRIRALHHHRARARHPRAGDPRPPPPRPAPAPGPPHPPRDDPRRLHPALHRPRGDQRHPRPGAGRDRAAVRAGVVFPRLPPISTPARLNRKSWVQWVWGDLE